MKQIILNMLFDGAGRLNAWGVVLFVLFCLLVVLLAAVLFVAVCQGREISLGKYRIGGTKKKCRIDKKCGKDEKKKKSKKNRDELMLRDFSGDWRSVYCQEEGEKIRKHEHVVRIEQRENELKGKTVRPLNDSDHMFSFTGSVRRLVYFAGSWESDAENSIVGGTIHLRICMEGDRMEGTHSYLNRGNVMQAGWTLERM